MLPMTRVFEVYVQTSAPIYSTYYRDAPDLAEHLFQ